MTKTMKMLKVRAEGYEEPCSGEDQLDASRID